MKKVLLLAVMSLVSVSAFAGEMTLWSCQGDGIETLQVANVYNEQTQKSALEATLSWDAGAGDYIESKTFEVKQISPKPGMMGGSTEFVEITKNGKAPRFTLSVCTDCAPRNGGIGGRVVARTPLAIDQDVTCNRTR